MLLALTPRRADTLQTLKVLVDETGGAVHYSLVAARMKISAWTAYDLLVELEKLGLAARRYAQAPGHAGRSRALFAPAAPRPADAPVAKAVLGAAFERFSQISDEAVAAQAYLAAGTADLAYHMGFWLARLTAAGRQGADAAKGVLESGAAPLQKAQTVAAMGLGSALARLGRGRDRLAARITRAAATFSANLEDAARSTELSDLVDASRRLELG